MRLTYDVEAGPPTSISITGYPLADGDRRLLETAWTESVVDDFLRDEATTIVRGALSEAGYLEPTIAATLERGEAKILRIVIQPGVRVSERRVRLDTPDEGLARQLDGWLREQDVDAIWAAPEQLQSGLTDELRSRGYLAATVAVGTATWRTVTGEEVGSGMSVVTICIFCAGGCAGRWKSSRWPRR